MKNKTKKQTENTDSRNEKLLLSDVRYSYEDVKKFCKENGYYLGEYWFPFRNTK